MMIVVIVIVMIIIVMIVVIVTMSVILVHINIIAESMNFPIIWRRSSPSFRLCIF